MITEENFIDFKCPYCQEPVSFPETDVGYARACPICIETLLVPQPGSETGARLPLPMATERLLLRRLIPSDWEGLLGFMANEEVFRYTTGGPLEEDDVLRWVELDQQVKLTTPEQMFYLAIEVKADEKLAGIVGLRFMDPLQAFVHVIVNPAFQRQGIGREAVGALLDFCFKGIHLHRVVARCDSRNLPALKLFERVGMRGEGEFVRDTPSQEGWLSTVYFAKLQDEA